jgi:hypothetical protein
MAIASAFSITPDELSFEYKPTIGSGAINWSGIFGLGLCSFFVGWMIVLGGEGTLFFDCNSLVLVLGMSFALLTISCGGRQAIEGVCKKNCVSGILSNSLEGIKNANYRPITGSAVS